MSQYKEWLKNIKSGGATFTTFGNRVTKLARQLKIKQVLKQQKDSNLQAKQEYLKRVENSRIQTYGFEVQVKKDIKKEEEELKNLN